MKYGGIRYMNNVENIIIYIYSISKRSMYYIVFFGCSFTMHFHAPHFPEEEKSEIARFKWKRSLIACLAFLKKNW